MKLAEALLERKQAKARLAELRKRLADSVLVQEGDRPAEDPEALLREMEEIAERLRLLTVRINDTNVTGGIEGGQTLMEAIAERDRLDQLHEIYRHTAGQATPQRDRFGRHEIRFVATVNAAGLHRRADAIARERRQLDVRIQEANWRIDLIE